MILDVWVDKRSNHDKQHPLASLELEMHSNSMIIDRSKQIRILGREHFLTGAEDIVADNIGITPGLGHRSPRIYPRKRQPHLKERKRIKAFLNYLKNSGVGNMMPKHTALYFHDEKSEPLAHVLPPIQVKRHVLDRWIRIYHQYMFCKPHTCIGHDETKGGKARRTMRPKKKTIN